MRESRDNRWFLGHTHLKKLQPTKKKKKKITTVSSKNVCIHRYSGVRSVASEPVHTGRAPELEDSLHEHEKKEWKADASKMSRLKVIGKSLKEEERAAFIQDRAYKCGGSSLPWTIDGMAITTKRVLDPWEMNENHTLFINSAKAIGCT